MWIFKPRKAKPPVIKEYYALGTILQFKVYGDKGELAIETAVKRLYEIDNTMSVFKPDSEVSLINSNAGTAAISVGKSTYFVIRKAAEYSELSQGAFDPTIRPLVALWGINTSNARIPEKEELDKCLKLVNYKDIVFDEKNQGIFLKQNYQSIDVGGIAKGYAADEVRDIFKSLKIKSAIIDLGGNIFALGKKPDGTPWTIGIQNPFKPQGKYVGTVNVIDKSVVTSGNYERFFISEGKRFHHLLDPRTGYPSENGVVSVTIISHQSIDGDALSTCGYILGLEKGLKLVEEIKGVEAIFITEDRKIYSTSGLKDDFTLLRNEFKYIRGDSL